jgi:hypothetical protein
MEDVEAYCPDPEEEPRFTLKCLRPNADAYPVLSLGGELKWKLEGYQNPGFGITTEEVIYPLQRILLHADV